MSDPRAHIAAWESAGLIDAATASRLRAASSEVLGPTPAEAGPQPWPPATVARETDVPPTVPSATTTAGRASTVGAIFGPGFSIGEMFGYLGAIFILGAWTSFAARTFGPRDTTVGLGIGALAAAAALAYLGFRLASTDPRGRRAAGVAYFVAVSYVAVATTAFLSGTSLGWPLSGIVVGAFALGAAIAARKLHPSILTQGALLGSATGLAGALLSWLESIIAPPQSESILGGGVRGSFGVGGPDPLALVFVAALLWLGLAVVIGYVGLWESRSAAADEAAGRRAALSRLWAGLAAVFGLSSAVTRSAYTQNFDDYHRVLAPWIGELAILILCAVLVERAFRREAGAYVYAAGFGLIIALTDLNVSYLSQTTEVALLIEGLILVGAGVAADRLRRRVERTEPGSPPAATPPTIEAATVAPTGAPQAPDGP